MKIPCGGFELGNGFRVEGNTLYGVTLIQLYSDGNAIYRDEESSTPMTYNEIMALLVNPLNLVTLYNGNYILRPEYVREQGEQNAIWFNGVTTLEGEPYIYRIIINTDNEVSADEYHLALAQN